MAELCSHAIACVVTQSLWLICNTKDSRYDAAEAMELLKEILAQIRVSADFPEHQAAVAFIYATLVSIRGQLQEWPEYPPQKYDGPWPKMPQPEANAVWEVKHPNRNLFWQEARAGLRFLRRHDQIFVGKPWDWFVDFLCTLDLALA